MTQRILFEYLLNTLWQVPLLALATWLLIRLARPALLLQHSLWTAALVLGVLLPLRGIAPVSAAAPARDGVLYPAFAAEPTLYLAQPFSPPAPHRPSLFTSRVHPLQLADSTISLLLELYAVTIAFSFARLIHGYLATRRIAAAAVAHPLTTLESTLLKACAHHLNLREPRIPELRFLADLNASPMIVGIRNPILLLPESLRHAGNPHFDDRALTAVLAHELAHIRRRDFLANLLTRILALPITYHPATQILHGRIRQTREMICDAHASLAFDAPSTYARSLLSLAATLIHAHAPAEAVGLFPHTRNMPVRKLEERIMKLTESHSPLTFAQRATRVGAGAAIILAATAAATLHLKPASPIVFAAVQYDPQQPAAAPQSPQAPSPAPAPTPAPNPHPSPRVIRNNADLTPEQRAKLQQDLDAAQAKINESMQQFNSPEFQAKLAEGMKNIDSPEFQQQMAQMKIDLKRLDSPEFRKQIADSQRIALDQHFNSPEFKQRMEALKLQMKDLHVEVDPKVHVDLDQLNRQMKDLNLHVDPQIKIDLDQLKQQLDSPEFRRQIEDAKKLAADAGQHQAERRQQLAEASRAIAEARAHITDAETQRKLDEAQRRIDQANRTF